MIPTEQVSEVWGPSVSSPAGVGALVDTLLPFLEAISRRGTDSRPCRSAACAGQLPVRRRDQIGTARSSRPAATGSPSCRNGCAAGLSRMTICSILRGSACSSPCRQRAASAAVPCCGSRWSSSMEAKNVTGLAERRGRTGRIAFAIPCPQAVADHEMLAVFGELHAPWRESVLPRRLAGSPRLSR